MIACEVTKDGSKMTENEKRLAGEIYDPMDEEILSLQKAGLHVMDEYNQTMSDEGDRRCELLKQMLGSVGKDCYIEPPFHANWGGKNIFFGSGVYANFNLSAVDDVAIYVGNHVMFGPNVTLITTNHPLEPESRKKGLQYSKPITIGENAWIGAGAMLLPGVTIGENTVIGAGSIVTKDIPSGVVAVGNPCRVVKKIL